MRSNRRREIGASPLRLSINAVTRFSGGGQTTLAGYLRAWQAIGAELDITLYSSQEQVIESSRGIRPDIRVVPFGVGLPLHRRLLLQQLTLGPRLVDSGTDVVLSTNTLLERCNAPQVVHHQNLLLYEDRSLLKSLRHGPKRWVQAYGARRALGRSSANVFISDYMRKEAEAVAPASRSKNVVIPNGLSDETISTSRRSSEWNGEPHLLAITSEEPHKDNATLVHVLAELARGHAEVPWTMSIAGSARLARERRLADKLGVARRIRWLGFVEPRTLDALYRRSLCLIHPSLREGFGMPPLEAMVRRCPVVAADCAAVPEVVGRAALLVEPRDSRRFAEAVFDLLDKPALRDELITLGVRRAAEFRWADSAARLYGLLAKVAGRPAAGHRPA